MNEGFACHDRGAFYRRSRQVQDGQSPYSMISQFCYGVARRWAPTCDSTECIEPSGCIEEAEESSGGWSSSVFFVVKIGAISLETEEDCRFSLVLRLSRPAANTVTIRRKASATAIPFISISRGSLLSSGWRDGIGSDSLAVNKVVYTLHPHHKPQGRALASVSLLCLGRWRGTYWIVGPMVLGISAA